MNEPTYEPLLDAKRLKTLRGRIQAMMEGGEWFTLRELCRSCGNSEAGISARLRELRNKFGYVVNRRRRGEPESGIWEYQLKGKTDE